MSESQAGGVQLERDELQSIQGKLQAVQDHLGELANMFGEKLRGMGGPGVVKSATFGVKVLVVHTADGQCYVYDGNRGVCRACEEGE